MVIESQQFEKIQADASAARADDTPQNAKPQNAFAEGFRNHTKGERLFNRISYFGFGYLLTTAVSIAMTWLLNDHKTIGPAYKKFADPIFEKIGIPESFRSISTLFIGGTIASVLPVKALEDNKATLVKKFDRLYYTDDQIKNDATIQAAYKTLDAEPKQTWLSVFSSRIVAFAATFSVYKLMGSNESLMARKSEHSLDSLSTGFARWFDRAISGPKVEEAIQGAKLANEQAIEATKHMKLGARGKVAGTEIIRDAKYGGTPDRIRSRLWSYIALDGFYTIITSITLFVFTRVLAPVFGKKGETPVFASAEPAAQTAAETPRAVSKNPQEPAVAPTNSISQAALQARVAEPGAMQELTV